MRQPLFASTAPYIAWHAHETPCATAIVEDAVQTDYQTLAALLARCVSDQS